MRYREDSPAVLDKARGAVAAWRDKHPGGTEEQMLAAVGGDFHDDYPPVLRAVLFTTDQRA